MNEYISRSVLKNPNEIVAEIINNETLSKISSGSIPFIIRLLSKAFTCEKKKDKVNLTNYLQKIALSKFVAQFLNEIRELRDKKVIAELNMFMDELLDVCASMLQYVPSVANDPAFSNMVAEIKIAMLEMNSHFNITLNNACIFKFSDIKEKVIESRTQTLHKTTKSKNRRTKKAEPGDDFRKLSLYPTPKDLWRKDMNFLRPNIIQGAYDSVDHYLDIQFRLMREDFFDCYRTAFRMYREAKTNAGDNTVACRFDSLKLYFKTKFERHKIRGRRVNYLLNFDVEKKLKINWETSQSFKYGSLLIFSKDDFKTFFCGTVDANDLEALMNGQVFVSLMDDVDTNYEFFNTHFLMAESSEFFEPYYYVMEVLQNLKANNFPLVKHIVQAKINVTAPAYLKKLRSWDVFGYEVNALNSSTWPNFDEIGLDVHQYKALQISLTRCLSVIQGPPGTGKTYLGLKIVEVLLKNMKRYEFLIKRPILVICYTNHALDQFLEGILEYTKEIIRVGGQSRSQKLERYNLSEMKIARSKMEERSSRKSGKFTMLKRILAEIDALNEEIEFLERPVGILSYECLRTVMLDSEKEKIIGDLELLMWLLETEDAEYWDDQDISFEKEPVYSEASTGNPLSTLLPKNKSDKKGMETNFENENEDTSLRYCLTLGQLRSHCEEIMDRIDVLVDLGEQEDADDEFEKQTEKLRIQKQKYDTLKQHLQQKEACKSINVNSDLRFLPIYSRWQVYRNWLNLLKNIREQRLKEFKTEYRIVRADIDKMQRKEEAEILSQMTVIGMTTSGAARRRLTLEILKPSIVIVEEAAEVLESHIVCSLTKDTEQLILIGDHKQLKPKTATFQIANNYQLDVSLFERMIMNKLECPVLRVQHRMRPEISDLISPAIYEELVNHSSVCEYESVLGVKKNVFFVEHSVPEQTIEFSTSHMNEHEAEFLLKFCTYLILQGYLKEQITILSTYKGQVTHFHNKIKSSFSSLKNVQVTAVDDYQGEENDIILLSLVRSNSEGYIGFLKVENRICVALSRAKKGLYIIGNMNILSNNCNLWSRIRSVLKTQEALGPELCLRCQKHGNETYVSKLRDFDKVLNGGCDQFCNDILSCKHKCMYLCHNLDADHNDKYACQQLSMRALPCGHVTELSCHINVTNYLCSQNVEFKSSICGHILTRMCFEKETEIVCPELCRRPLKCGHFCSQTCHRDFDPDHLKFKCLEACEKLNQGCTKNHKCEKRCYEQCGTCNKLEEFLLKCNHIIKMECSADLTGLKCPQKCQKLCGSCGQKCTKLCWESCKPCKNEIEKKIPKCGHKVALPCSQIPSRQYCKAVIRLNQKSLCGHNYINSVRCCDLSTELNVENYLQNCEEPCTVNLQCGHKCSATCGLCLQGRLHRGCRERCNIKLFCGHTCRYPCREVCPPCFQPSLFKCMHSGAESSKLCGAPFSCSRRCEWKCKHQICNRRCDEICDRKVCIENCRIKLLCGHECIGFCGEPCPYFCGVCDSKDMPNNVFGFRKGARCVWMEDCQHTIESSTMEKYLASIEMKVAIPDCPQCHTPIVSTLRFMNEVKCAYQRIAQLKIQTLDDRIINIRKTIKENLKEFYDFDAIGLSPLGRIKEYFLQLIFDRVDIIPNANLLPMSFFTTAFNDIGFRLTKMEPGMLDDVICKKARKFLISVLNVKPISIITNLQVMHGLRLEMIRFHRILTLGLILCRTSNKNLKKVPRIKELKNQLENYLYNYSEYLPEKDIKVDVLLKELLLLTKQIGLSADESDMMRFLKNAEFVNPLKGVVPFAI